MKENADSGENVPVNLTDKGAIPLKAGTYSLTITVKGNYSGSVTRTLYIASKAQLLKNASVKCKGTITNTLAGRVLCMALIIPLAIRTTLRGAKPRWYLRQNLHRAIVED